MSYVSRTPKPPYYAAIFTSINAGVDHTEHVEMSARMMEIASNIDGYLGIEPARNNDGTGVAVSYWRDLEAIKAFAHDPEHRTAKKLGRDVWYDHYMIRIALVERAYGRPDYETNE